MKNIKLLQEIIHVAEKCGDVCDVGVYETWLYAIAITDDGTKIRFDVNITKEEKENGN